MVGKDATDEMHAYHCDETVDTFTRFKIGEIEGPRWENLLPNSRWDLRQRRSL